MPLSPSIKVIFDLHDAVDTYPGSKVNMPDCFERLRISRTGGPSVPSITGISYFFPVALSISEYVVKRGELLMISSHPFF
jgi:hypothetical protein